MGRGYGATILIEDQSLQQSRLLDSGPIGSLAGADFQDAVDLVPEDALDDGLVFTRISCALVDGFADIDPVVEQPVVWAKPTQADRM